ncbi:response regulator [Paenibacillus sp.]|uniref:response regulator n=1 Tax=Paenibacillus sp. TaxID=58172 RepID=UPI0028116950|nr:response regulator [Paenibacillus sp.]
MARILVVDDAAFMRVLIRDALESRGHEVVGEAENGEDAVRQFVRLKPDVVTMDITLRESNGFHGLQRIRAIEPRAKVILCSALGRRGVVLEAMASGASDFLIKPFHAERVVQAVEAQL